VGGGKGSWYIIHKNPRAEAQEARRYRLVKIDISNPEILKI